MPLYALYLFPLFATAGVAWVALTTMGRPPGELAANANYLATLLRQRLDLDERDNHPAGRARTEELAGTIRAEADAVRRELEREHRERRLSRNVAIGAAGLGALLAVAMFVALPQTPAKGDTGNWLALLAAVLATIFVPAVLRITLWNMLPELTVTLDILDFLEKRLRDASSGNRLVQQAFDRYANWKIQRTTLLGRIRLRLLGLTSAEQR